MDLSPTETKQISSLKPSTWAKGFIAQKIARKHAKAILRADVLYVPDRAGPEPFDFIGVAFAEHRISGGDFKAKPARTYYPDTGINISQHDRYGGFAKRYRMPFPLIFIDESFGIVYGNFWRILSEPRNEYWNGNNLRYPIKFRGIIYYPVAYMRVLGELTWLERQMLKMTSTRNENYSPNEKVRSRIGVGLKADSFEPLQFVFGEAA